MRPINFYAAVAIATFFVLHTPVYSNATDVVTDFSDALYKQSTLKMESVVQNSKEEVPEAINRLLAEALKPGLSQGEKKDKFYLLERLAVVYKDVTGDFRPLKKVKRGNFDSKLSPVAVSTKTDGVHIVLTVSTATVKNMFKPDNIIISSGDTVRWVNSDTTTHLLASVMTSIGEGGIFSPNVEPGQSWEHTFNTPGEYFYICFIHKVMYGKILVKE